MVRSNGWRKTNSHKYMDEALPRRNCRTEGYTADSESFISRCLLRFFRVSSKGALAIRLICASRWKQLLPVPRWRPRGVSQLARPQRALNETQSLRLDPPQNNWVGGHLSGECRDAGGDSRSGRVGGRTIQNSPFVRTVCRAFGIIKILSSDRGGAKLCSMCHSIWVTLHSGRYKCNT